MKAECAHRTKTKITKITKNKIFLPKTKSFFQKENLFTKIKIFLPKSKSFY